MKLPKSVSQFFWGDDLQKLNWQDHRDYITKTILDKGDLQANAWILKKTTKPYLKKLLKTEKINPKSKNFWQIYLS